MSFAVFEGDTRLTRSFPSREAAWKAADNAGLVVIGPDGEKVLDDQLEIRPCEPTPDEASDSGSDLILSS